MSPHALALSLLWACTFGLISAAQAAGDAEQAQHPVLTLTGDLLGEKFVTLTLGIDGLRANQGVSIERVITSSNLATCFGDIKGGSSHRADRGGSLKLISDCERKGKDEALFRVVTGIGQKFILIPKPTVNTCRITYTRQTSKWVGDGCAIGSVLTPQLHNRPERPFNISVSVGNGKRLTGGVCENLNCRAVPGFDNGCAFGRKLGQTQVNQRHIEVKLMVGSHPQIWQIGFDRQKLSQGTNDDPQKPFDVSYGTSFSVFVPNRAGPTPTTLKCSISGNELRIDPSNQSQPTSAELERDGLRRIGHNPSSGGENYKFEVLPRRIVGQ